MAEPLSRVNGWIRSARMFDAQERLAVVRVAEGVTLEATLATVTSSTSSGTSGGSPSGQGPNNVIPTPRRQEFSIKYLYLKNYTNIPFLNH